VRVDGVVVVTQFFGQDLDLAQRVNDLTIMQNFKLPKHSIDLIA
jgi:hypothetical protein